MFKTSQSSPQTPTQPWQRWSWLDWWKYSQPLDLGIDFAKEIQRFKESPELISQGDWGYCGVRSILKYLVHWQHPFIDSLACALDRKPLSTTHHHLLSDYKFPLSLRGIWQRAVWPTGSSDDERFLGSLHRRTAWQITHEWHKRWNLLRGRPEDNLTYYICMAIMQVYKLRTTPLEWWRTNHARTPWDLANWSPRNFVGDFPMHDQDVSQIFQKLTGEVANIVKLDAESLTLSENFFNQVSAQEFIQGARNDASLLQSSLLKPRWQETYDIIDKYCRKGGCILRGKTLKIVTDDSNELFNFYMKSDAYGAKELVNVGTHFIYVPPPADPKDQARGIFKFTEDTQDGKGKTYSFDRKHMSHFLSVKDGKSVVFFCPQTIISLPVPSSL